MLHHRQKIFEKLRTRKGEKIIFFETSFFIFYYVWVSFPSKQVLFYKSYTDSWQKIIRMMSSFFFLRCWTNLLCDQTRPYILIEVQMNISVLVRKLSLNSYNIKLSAFLRPISVLNFFYLTISLIALLSTYILILGDICQLLDRHQKWRCVHVNISQLSFLIL